MPDKYEDILRLIIGEYDGTLTAKEFSLLEELLVQDPAILDFYVNCYHTISCFNTSFNFLEGLDNTDAELTNIEGPLWQTLSTLELESPPSDLPKPPPEKVIVEKLAIQSPPRKVSKWTVFTAVVSSAALIFFLVMIRYLPTPPMRTPIGKVVHVTNAAFEKGVRPLTEGRDVFAETISLTSGSVLIELETQTSIFLAAPIRVDLRNTDYLQLTSGKLLARVSPQGVGFTISMPHGSVVVYGTEFSLSVDAKGTTQVEVFNGKVDLRNNSDPLAAARSYLLAAGQVGKVTADGDLLVESKTFPPAAPQRRSLEKTWAGTHERALWNDPFNWDNQEIPNFYSPAFFQGLATRSICVIDDTHTGDQRARAEYVNIGLWGYGCLEMTGGELETEEIWVGRRDGGEGIFTMTGGVVTLTERRDGIIIGKSWEKKAGHGVMNFRGGVLQFQDPSDNMILGWGYPARGVLNVEGGELTLPNQLILGADSDEVQSPVPLLGTGVVNVSSGILRAGSLLIRQGRVDVQGGIFILRGDVRPAVQGHITHGELTAYDGNGTFRITYDAAADETWIRAEQ